MFSQGSSLCWRGLGLLLITCSEVNPTLPGAGLKTFLFLEKFPVRPGCSFWVYFSCRFCFLGSGAAREKLLLSLRQDEDALQAAESFGIPGVWGGSREGREKQEQHSQPCHSSWVKNLLGSGVACTEKRHWQGELAKQTGLFSLDGFVPSAGVETGGKINVCPAEKATSYFHACK